MSSFETAGQDLLLVEQAEALAAGTTISEDDQYLISGLRSYHIGDRRGAERSGPRDEQPRRGARKFLLPARWGS